MVITVVQRPITSRFWSSGDGTEKKKIAATNGQEGMEVVRIIETVHRFANHPI